MKRLKHGFTFIELLITFGIVSMSVPVIISLFLINLRTQARFLTLQEVKSNGDYILLQSQSLIRQRAKSVHSATPGTVANEVCVDAASSYVPAEGANLYFKDHDGNTFYLARENDNSVDKIASKSATQTFYYTNNRVIISNWTISCKRASLFSHPIIFMSFTTTSVVTTNETQGPASLNFQTAISLRN